MIRSYFNTKVPSVKFIKPFLRWLLLKIRTLFDDKKRLRSPSGSAAGARNGLRGEGAHWKFAPGRKERLRMRLRERACFAAAPLLLREGELLLLLREND